MAAARYWMPLSRATPPTATNPSTCCTTRSTNCCNTLTRPAQPARVGLLIVLFARLLQALAQVLIAAQTIGKAVHAQHFLNDALLIGLVTTKLGAGCRSLGFALSANRLVAGDQCGGLIFLRLFIASGELNQPQLQ